ncbi:MAG: SDR family oxidoreductase [Deltaproteobacteria bacterium]
MPKVAVITGAGKGIGREVAINFAKEGVTVAICARNYESVKSLEREIRQMGGGALALACDVGADADAQRFIDEAASITGRIDVLVNNAGIARVGRVGDFPSEAWEEVIRTNLTGAFFITKRALGFMSRGSHIFNLGSNASKIGFPNWAAYCASKFGMLGFTNSLREEVRAEGIKVTAVLAGPTDTPLWDDVAGNWDRGQMMKPQDIASMIISVWKQPPSALTDEISILPAGGSL